MAHEQYQLEKPLWTEADFEQMGWHDVSVHAIAVPPDRFELWFDIDHIFRWVDPQAGETHYSFWIAPATLVFHDVFEFDLNIESHMREMSLQRIDRADSGAPRDATEKRLEWEWLLDFNEGEIKFRSVGFSQFTRRAPIFVRSQYLKLEERGGISFGREYVA